MYISDTALVPYAGYQIAVSSTLLGNARTGRGIFTSTKLGCLIVVEGANVYRVTINYNQTYQRVTSSQSVLIGSLNSSSGVVYITENNKPQIGISDGVNFYLYDETLSPNFQTVTGLNFVPGYLTFHDTYFILAASYDDTYSPAVNNTWRLSASNDGTSWPSTANSVGLLQTKPDNVQAVVRFPSKGNMIFVMGSVVTEAWFDTGAQLFPYQRNNQFNIDYGCVQAATVAYLDEFVVWLGQNEQSGPIILASDGGMPRKITTDGIDYLFSTLQNPADSQAFLYRQDGHLFYHLNFYTDNLSLVYDFNTEKFYSATDDKGNYFIAAQVAFFNNQYYFVTKNNGNLFALDTEIPTYDSVDSAGEVTTVQIPRRRVCSNIRTVDQDYKVMNDLGFTIESGETPYVQQSLGALLEVTQDLEFIMTQDGVMLSAQQEGNSGFGPLSLPAVDLRMSLDGGATFGSGLRQVLRPIGQRKNKLVWWIGCVANDAVFEFTWWSWGRVIAMDGVINCRI